jgi:hypothetical protein
MHRNGICSINSTLLFVTYLFFINLLYISMFLFCQLLSFLNYKKIETEKAVFYLVQLLKEKKMLCVLLSKG